MSEKEIKKAKSRLYGRLPARENTLIGLSIFTFIFYIIAILFISIVISKEDFPFIVAFASIILIEALWIFSTVLMHRKHCHELKSNFELLPSHYQEELINAAHNYNPKQGLCHSSNFIYGYMSEYIGSSKKMGYLCIFMYIPISELTWSYKIEKYADMTGQYNSTSVVRLNNEDQVMFNTNAGKRFKAKALSADIMEIANYINIKNPNCQFGYSNELKKFFNKLI